MVRNKREAQALGKLGKGRPKTYTDPAKAIEQRRQAGIRSGIKRRQLALERVSDSPQ